MVAKKGDSDISMGHIWDTILFIRLRRLPGPAGHRGPVQKRLELFHKPFVSEAISRPSGEPSADTSDYPFVRAVPPRRYPAGQPPTGLLSMCRPSREVKPNNAAPRGDLAALLPVDVPGEVLAFAGGELLHVGDDVLVFADVDEHLAPAAVVYGAVLLPVHEELDLALVGLDVQPKHAVLPADLVDPLDCVQEIAAFEGLADQLGLVVGEIAQSADDADLDFGAVRAGLNKRDELPRMGDGERVCGVDPAVYPLVDDRHVQGPQRAEMHAAHVRREIPQLRRAGARQGGEIGF